MDFSPRLLRYRVLSIMICSQDWQQNWGPYYPCICNAPRIGNAPPIGIALPLTIHCIAMDLMHLYSRAIIHMGKTTRGSIYKTLKYYICPILCLWHSRTLPQEPPLLDSLKTPQHSNNYHNTPPPSSRTCLYARQVA